MEFARPKHGSEYRSPVVPQDNAPSFKDGTGSIHTSYMAIKRRKCNKCKKVYQDTCEDLGLTFSSFCTAFNSWLHTAHARLQLSCYRQQIEARAAQPSSSNGGQQILFGPPPPPPVVAYPPLDESNSQLLPNYAIEVFIKAIQPRIEEHHLLQATFATHVAKADANFKLDGLGMTDEWRGLNHGHVACFPTLGKGLFTGDCGVRWDMYHGINVMRDSCRGNHPLIKEAFEELVDKLTWVDDHGAFQQWANKWSTHGLDHCTRLHIFSVDTYRLFDTFSKAIMLWFFSDPWVEQADGSYLPMEMYIEAKGGSDAPELLSCKNTSLVESRHSNSNRMSRSAGCKRTNDDLRETLVEIEDSRWDRNRLARINGWGSPIQDMGLMQEINKLHVDLGLQQEITPASGSQPAVLNALPYPDILPTAPSNPYVMALMKAACTMYAWDHMRGARCAAEVVSIRKRRIASDRAVVEMKKQMHKEMEGAIKAGKFVMPDPQPLPVMTTVPTKWLFAAPHHHEQPSSLPQRVDYLSSDFMAVINAQEGSEKTHDCEAEESDEVEEHEEEEAAAALVGMQNQSAEDAACTPSSKLPSSQTSPKSSMRRSGRNQSAEDATCTPSSKLPSPQTSPPSGGWRAGRSLNGSVQVEAPFTLHSRGSSRRASKFVSHGGITKIVPTDRPISTQAEKVLWAELLPQCTRNGKTDFRALRDAFNQRFAQLFQPGAPDVPDDKMLYSKSVTHLRSYFNTQHHAFRANDSHRFNRGVAAMPGAAQRGLVPETEPAQLATECVDLSFELGASQPDLASTAAQPALEIGAAQHSLESRAPQLGHGIGDAQHSLQSTAAQQGLEIEAAQLGPAIGAAQPTIVYGQQSMLRFCAPMASKRQKTAHATASPSVVASATAVATSAWNYLTGSRAVGERPSANQHTDSSQLPASANQRQTAPAPSPQLQPSSNRHLQLQAPIFSQAASESSQLQAPSFSKPATAQTPVTKKSYMCNSCAILGHKLLL
eukprot:gene10981-17752_t